jgi:succinyl-CoA synthetase beta subunit
MLGKTLVTKQTGPDGKIVNRLYVEEGCDIKKEYYLSMLIDRSTSSISIITSTEGGMEIEEVAEKEPEKIITINVPGDSNIDQQSLDKLVEGLQVSDEQSQDFCDQVQKIYQSFLSSDASMVEINPFVLTGEGNFLALDAKVSIDDNALYKHKDILSMRDETEEDAAEVEASKHELNYVKLDGSIGCMVNGAGLAMGTMDIIQLHGGSPANFLDVGGGATKERVAKAFSIILQDPNVKAILVNIFGGIMKCDIIAEGVVAAAKELAIEVPLIVRLEGTNVELGKEILNKSGLAIISADNLEDAAQKAVKSLG